MADEKEQQLEPERAIEIAKKLRKAMKGFGTDEKALLEQLTPLTASQSVQVRQAYTDEIERDLVEDLKSELRGKLEDAMVTLVQSPAEALARTIHEACAGLGTDEELLAEAVCTASDEEIKGASFWYRRAFESILVDEVESELGGKYKKLLVLVLRSALSEDGRPTPGEDQLEEDVLRLYKAGEDKIGTNSAVFIEIIGSNSREYMGQLSEAYAKKYGKSLAKVIKSEMGGDLERGLLALVKPVEVTLGEALFKAMDGMGTDEAPCVRIICGRRNHLNAINQWFLANHESSLARFVKKEFSGDLEDTLVGVCKRWE